MFNAVGDTGFESVSSIPGEVIQLVVRILVGRHVGWEQ